MSWPTQWSEQTPSIYHQHCCSKCLPPSAAVVDFAPFIKPRTRAAALMQSSELDGEITCEDFAGKKNTEFHSFTASFMKTNVVRKKSLPTSSPMGPAPFHGSWCTSWVSSDRSRSSPAVHPATYLPTTIQLYSSGEPETPSGWRCLNLLFSNGYLKLDVADS